MTDFRLPGGRQQQRNSNVVPLGDLSDIEADVVLETLIEAITNKRVDATRPDKRTALVRVRDRLRAAIEAKKGTPK